MIGRQASIKFDNRCSSKSWVISYPFYIYWDNITKINTILSVAILGCHLQLSKDMGPRLLCWGQGRPFLNHAKEPQSYEFPCPGPLGSHRPWFEAPYYTYFSSPFLQIRPGTFTHNHQNAFNRRSSKIVYGVKGICEKSCRFLLKKNLVFCFPPPSLYVLF